MKQGEIWQVYLDPVKGNKQQGNRPAVIISGKTLNDHLGVVIVCPITSSVHHYEGNPVLKPTSKNGLQSLSEIMVFHVHSISKSRFKKQLGVVTQAELEQIKATLNDILKY